MIQEDFHFSSMFCFCIYPQDWPRREAQLFQVNPMVVVGHHKSSSTRNMGLQQHLCLSLFSQFWALMLIHELWVLGLHRSSYQFLWYQFCISTWTYFSVLAIISVSLWIHSSLPMLYFRGFCLITSTLTVTTNTRIAFPLWLRGEEKIYLSSLSSA